MGHNDLAVQIKHMKGLKIGYCGPIDQRINFELVKDMADYHPAWNFIFTETDDAELLNTKPQRPNIYFLKTDNQNQPYSCLKNLDIALIPYKQDNQEISEETVHQFLNEGLPLITNVNTITTAKYELMGLIKTAKTATGLSILCEQIWQQIQKKPTEISNFL